MKPVVKAVLTLMVVAGLVVGGVALAQTGDDDGPPPTDRPGYQRMLDVLGELVDQGVITQDQAEAVAEHLTGAGAWSQPPRRPGHDLLADTAAMLDLSVEELWEQLRRGATPAEIAGDRSEALIADLVDAVSARIEAAFTDGRIGEEQRDLALQTLEERVRRFVEEGLPPEGFHGPGHGPRFGRGGPMGPHPGPNGPMGPHFGPNGPMGPHFDPGGTDPGASFSAGPHTS